MLLVLEGSFEDSLNGHGKHCCCLVKNMLKLWVFDEVAKLKRFELLIPQSSRN